MASPAGRPAAGAGRGPEEGWGWGRWGACRGRRRPPPAPGLSPGPPGRLRPRRHAEPGESPSSPRGGRGGAAWARGGGRRAGERPGAASRAGRVAGGPGPSGSAPEDLPRCPRRSGESCCGGTRGGEGWRNECGGEGRARPEPAGPQEVEGRPEPSPRAARPPLSPNFRAVCTDRCEAALRGTHTTSEAKNDLIVNSCGCSVELFLKRWQCSDF